MNGEDGDERIMNDSTMPPPPRVTVGGAGGTKSNHPASVPSKQPRRKNGRFGMAEWTRLLRLSNDLAQRKGKPIRRKIPWSEIRQHNRVYDGWVVLRGKVYNLSPYLSYHPGGESILKSVLGRDATALYDKYHRWVNADGLIGKLLIGYVDTTSSGSGGSIEKSDADGFAMPAPKPPNKSAVAPTLLSTEAETEEEDAVNPWEKETDAD